MEPDSRTTEVWSMAKIIEIELPFDMDIPVELQIAIDKALTKHLCKPYKETNPTRTMWVFGMGSKPIFSQADSMFLGKPVDPNAPEDGEPEFDDSVFHMEITERGKHPKEV